MDTKWFDMGEIDIAWCPGCGNFAILNALKQALSELEIKPERLRYRSGGQGTTLLQMQSLQRTARTILTCGNRHQSGQSRIDRHR